MSPDVLVALITSSTTIASLVLKDFVKDMLTKKKPVDLSSPEIEDVIQPVLDNIRDYLDASRVCYWEGSNGEKTLSGFHIKKLSVFAESLAEGKNQRPMIDDCKLLPVTMFSRLMGQLKNTPYNYIVSNECLHKDTLSDFYNSYGIATQVVMMVKTKANRWTGLVVVSFDAKRVINEKELAWLGSQTGRIGVIISKL